MKIQKLGLLSLFVLCGILSTPVKAQANHQKVKGEGRFTLSLSGDGMILLVHRRLPENCSVIS